MTLMRMIIMIVLRRYHDSVELLGCARRKKCAKLGDPPLSNPPLAPSDNQPGHSSVARSGEGGGGAEAAR